MDSKELLDYSKNLITELKLKYDKEFREMLGTAVKEGLITENDKSHLIGDRPNIENKISFYDEKSIIEEDPLDEESNTKDDL